MSGINHVTYLGQDHEYRLQQQGRLELVPQPEETSRDISDEAGFPDIAQRSIADEPSNRTRWLAGLEGRVGNVWNKQDCADIPREPG